MDEWIEILKVKRRALDQMSYCDWKLNSIDENVRNREFSNEEYEMYRRLEEEKDKHRKIFNNQDEILIKSLATVENADKLITVLEEKKENDKKADKFDAKIYLYITWVQEARKQILERNANKNTDEQNR